MKKIVLLSDGTGNGAAKRNKTNVWRLYRALDLHGNGQIAMYDDGVGTQQFLLFRLLGGAFGWGLKQNVIELYKFLCRNYKPDSDQIYLFGFSRGAFTVRVLAGLIAECGICTDYDSERDLHVRARRNFALYRTRYKSWYSGLLFRGRSNKNESNGASAKIEFIGVWDTVDAYGFPVDYMAKLWDKWIYPLRFPDQQLWKRVARACHAISIDDERHTFEPVLWDERGKEDSERIEQVWFPGVHSDVGGGYPRDELALVALDWMISRVEVSDNNGSGLHFRADLRREYWHRSDWNGAQHDSRSGLAAYYRYKPRNIASLCNGSDAKSADVKIDLPKIHRSVLERIRGKVVPYAPTGLPEEYEVVSTRGETTPKFEDEQQRPARAEAMKGALAVTGWRRWLYRAFLATTAMLLFSQFYLDWDAGAPCNKVSCATDQTLKLIGYLLPDFVSGWIEALRQNPEWMLPFAILIGALSLLKWAASAETLNRAMAAWAHLNGQGDGSSPSPTGEMNHRGLSSRQVLRKFLWPVVVAIALVTLLAIMVLAVERVSFRVRDGMGWLCQPTDAVNLTTDQSPFDFEAANPCLATQVALVAGRTYQFDVQTELPWADGDIPARPDGLEVPPSPLMLAATPLLRHRTRPWFELTGRVGHSGRETFSIGSGACYTARSDGELFLYVNDAVFGLLPDRHWALPYFWSVGRNIGEARITVSPVEPSPACESWDYQEAF